MIFSTFLVSAFATLALASPLDRRQSSIFGVQDVLSALNGGTINNGPAFCSTLLGLSPNTVSSIKTKTVLTKLKVYTTTYQDTMTSTVTDSTAMYTAYVPATATSMITVTDDTLIVTAYVTAAPADNQKRGTPQLLKKFPSSLLSSGCSSYISTTRTKTLVSTLTVFPTTTKSKTVHKKFTTTFEPITSITTTSTITVTTNAFTGVQSTITATSTLSAGQSLPTTDSGNSYFKPLGCYSEGIGGRALQYLRGQSDTGMTVSDCINNYCQGFRYAGLEYGRECWCGNSIMFYSSQVADSDCSSECTGDEGTFCGNNNRLSVYQSDAMIPPNAFNDSSVAEYKGCYSEPPSSSQQRALRFEFTDDVNESMTAETCISTCQSQGYQFAGVEYGRECWCDSTLNSLAIMTDDSQCSFSCEGKAVEQCGGNSV